MKYSDHNITRDLCYVIGTPAAESILRSISTTNESSPSSSSSSSSPSLQVAGVMNQPVRKLMTVLDIGGINISSVNTDVIG